MKGLILLNSNENTKKVETEEKAVFIRQVLMHIGLPIQDIWAEENTNLTVEDRIKLRSILSKFNVSVIDDIDGGLKIYVDKDIIASWDKPHYVLKRDLSQIDPKKFLYLEMHVTSWSVFEESVNG